MISLLLALVAATSTPVPEHPVRWIDDPEHLSRPVALYAVPGAQASAKNAPELAHALAPMLAKFSQETGTEACARFCKLPDGSLMASAVSVRSHLFCVAPDDLCPEGSTPQETIHSHPPQKVFCANAVDALILDDPPKAGDCGFAGDPDSFSPQDKTATKAWLVGSLGQVLYWREDPKPPAPLLAKSWWLDFMENGLHDTHFKGEDHAHPASEDSKP